MKGILLVVIGIVVLTVLVALFGSQPPQGIIGVPVGRQACDEAAARGDPPPFPECPALLDQ